MLVHRLRRWPNIELWHKNVNPLSIKREYSLIRLYGEDKS